MSNSLVRQLVAALLSGLLVALAVSVLTRLYLQLPALYEMEQVSDQKDVDRVRRAGRTVVDKLVTTAANYSAWDDAYRFMTLAPSDEAYQSYIKANHGWTAHRLSQVHGWLYLDRAGEPFFSSYYDLQSGVQVRGRQLDAASLSPQLFDESRRRADSNILSFGLSSSNLGPIFVVVADIVPTVSGRSVSRGQLVLWRELDGNLLAELEENTQRSLGVVPIDEARADPLLNERVAYLEAGNDFQPRGDSENLYWLLDDITGTPRFLVRQEAHQRFFDDSLFSISLLSQFSTAVIVLAMISTFFLRKVVFRVQNAQTLMQKINTSGDLSLRLVETSGARDELGRLFGDFNDLLARLQAQDETLRRTNRSLEEQTERDPLTGIYNRRFLESNLEFAISSAVRAERPISVAMIDVDAFKPYNDNYGHGEGDEALKKVARCLAKNMPRKSDIVARYGGEEFSVIMVDTPVENAWEVMRKLCKHVEELAIPHLYADHSEVVTVSIGVAGWVPGRDDHHRDYLKAADIALYNAKQSGRNRVSVSLEHKRD